MLYLKDTYEKKMDINSEFYYNRFYKKVTLMLISIWVYIIIHHYKYF